MNQTSIEQDIQNKGLTAPRITTEIVEANIVSEHYFTGDRAAFPHEVIAGSETTSYEALRLLTFCILILRNGFTVTGTSACASPENFDAEIEQRIARQNAVAQVWPLMGYTLKQQLHTGGL